MLLIHYLSRYVREPAYPDYHSVSSPRGSLAGLMRACSISIFIHTKQSDTSPRIYRSLCSLNFVLTIVCADNCFIKKYIQNDASFNSLFFRKSRKRCSAQCTPCIPLSMPKGTTVIVICVHCLGCGTGAN